MKLNHDKPLSNFAFNCNLRHYIMEDDVYGEENYAWSYTMSKQSRAPPEPPSPQSSNDSLPQSGFHPEVGRGWCSLNPG